LADRAERRYQQRIERDLARWARTQGRRRDDPEAVLAFISGALSETIERLTRLSEAFQRFTTAHERAPTPVDRRRVILDFAEALGAGRLALVRDRTAFRRWFDGDAVIERYHNRVGEAERHAVALSERAGIELDRALAQSPDSPEAAWQRLDPEGLLRPALAYPGDSRVARTAFATLAGALDRVPAERRERLLSHDAARMLYQAAQDPERDCWLQCEALALLARVRGSDFDRLAARRLRAPASDPDLFVRARLVTLLRERFEANGGAEPLAQIEQAAGDPSAYVRQRVCQQTPALPDERALSLAGHRLVNDPAHQVRGTAALALGELARRPGADEAGATIAGAMTAETHPFVLRCMLRAFEPAPDARETETAGWQAAALGVLDELHRTASSTPVRREAANAAERRRVAMAPALDGLRQALTARCRGLRPGRRCRIPRQWLDGLDAYGIGRVLAVLAQDDFGYEMGWGLFGPWVRRGERTGFRFWRLIFETRRPSPDKRQGHRHTIGRVFSGSVVAPSAIMGELSPTKVPGEPLFLGEEGGWRPYLPLPDHAISAVDGGGRVRLFTAEGVTTLTPPRGLWPGLRAKLALSWRFERFAQARNWTHLAAVPPNHYAAMLRAARVGIDFSGHEGREPEPRAARFFGIAPFGIPLFDRDLWDRFRTYFVSVYENSLRDLLVFLAGAAALFLLRRFQLLRRIRRNRRQLPLVLGGWGTRGKSGTERLKTGLMNALGYSVFSKTTGCEAMFIYGPAHRPMREMFLFRPYDKATIWEQASVADLARRLGTDVFLWECMGLTPSYVRILQSQWMRDDVSTITNTYPDHEDLQGPAGRDIPYVMTEFIPPRSLLITSEEQMQPILRQSAGDKGSAFDSVGWCEAGLITDDVLARFPYDEHPFNIALVTRMAEHLAIAPDFAVKEMADRVVPDLGVLKTFPVAPLAGRRLEFVNGMSANERFGSLGNWARMGFDRQDPRTEPGVAITTVVNNRADRIARSRVFASMLVHDMAADRHVLIGGNLEGLEGYISEALEARLGGLTLWPSGGEAERSPLQVLDAEAAWQRQVRDDAELAGQLATCLPAEAVVERYTAHVDEPSGLKEALAADGIGHTEAIAEHAARWAQQRDAYQALRARVAAASGPDEALDAAFRDWVRACFRAKLFIVHDYHASGDAIIQHIADLTATGHLNRVMGIQNIKGTGLDFIYTWLAWELAHGACQDLLARDPRRLDDAMNRLLAFRDHGAVTYETVRGAVDSALARPECRTEGRQAALHSIAAAADAAAPGSRDEGPVQASLPRPIRAVLDNLEAFLDAGDAVRRRRKADRIYRDLVAERIGYDRATKLLLELTKRQKGGWLSRSVEAWWQRRSSRRQ
jgi:poly-gamma-glutamate synthase PgsB/CapB